MFEQEQEIIVAKKVKWLIPEVSVIGQPPHRTANIRFQRENEKGERLVDYHRHVSEKEFDEFYANWKDDASLFKYIEHIEVPEDLSGDMLNMI
jgi:hypothetical protein